MSHARARHSNLALVTPPPSPDDDAQAQAPPPPSQQQQQQPEQQQPEQQHSIQPVSQVYEDKLAEEYATMHPDLSYLCNLMPGKQSVRPELGRIAELLLFGGQPSLATGTAAMKAAVAKSMARLLLSETSPPYRGVLIDVRQFGANGVRCTGPADLCEVRAICGTTGQPWPAM